MRKIPWQPHHLLPDGVVVTCNCRTRDLFDESIPARSGLKKIAFDKIGQTVRRRCGHCKKRWKIKVDVDHKDEHTRKLGYIAFLKEV